MSAQSSATGGVSAVGLLGVAFVVLRLTGVVGWSWWWVLAPFWAPWALAAVVCAVGVPVVLWLGRRR